MELDIFVCLCDMGPAVEDGAAAERLEARCDLVGGVVGVERSRGVGSRLTQALPQAASQLVNDSGLFVCHSF